VTLLHGDAGDHSAILQCREFHNTFRVQTALHGGVLSPREAGVASLFAPVGATVGTIIDRSPRLLLSRGRRTTPTYRHHPSLKGGNQ
jgi:hypothetical protein